MDSYSICFCGSGDKYKFCCQKAEAQIIRVERLIQSEELGAALAAASEGLRKFPETAMLVMHKAMLEGKNQDFHSARLTLESFLARRPRHAGALGQLILVIAELDGPLAAVVEFQRVAGSLTDNQRALFHTVLTELASSLAENDMPVAAMAHQFLAITWSGGQAAQFRAFSEMLADPSVSLFLRQFPMIRPAPESVKNEQSALFDLALGQANRGAFLEAASSFEKITDRELLPLATHNRGVVLAYVGQNASAIACLRGYIGTLGESDQAVDLEAFCQQLADDQTPELIDMIQLSWPIRSRQMLEQSLADSGRFKLIKAADESAPAEDPQARRSYYAMLDRKQLAEGTTASIDNLPVVVATVTVEDKTLTLTDEDDGSLDKVSDDLRDLAGAALVPAHPRTKHVGKNPKRNLTSPPLWILPEGIGQEQKSDLYTLFFQDLIVNRMKNEGVPELGGLTVYQYAESGKSRVPLRALLRRIEISPDFPPQLQPVAELRGRLGLPAESADPLIPLKELNSTRLVYVNIESLPTADLAEYCKLTGSLSLFDQAEKAMRRLIATETTDPEVLKLVLPGYFDLAGLVSRKEGIDAALDILLQGKARDPEAKKPLGELQWDLFALRLKAMLMEPQHWVPGLAVMLQQFSRNNEALSTIIPVLVQLGLLRPYQDPARPDRISIDSSLLDALVDKFGPKITTPSGGLGVAAGKPSLWTPESETAKAGGGKLWTPGQPKPGGEEGSKLIIPGGR
jgi:hypothetical protein